MPKYKMVVYTNPVAGRDDEYNRWYDEQHIPDVCNVPGILSAERFELRGDGPHRYLAIYNLETDDVDAMFADLSSRTGTDRMPMTDALDMSSVAMKIWRAR